MRSAAFGTETFRILPLKFLGAVQEGKAVSWNAPASALAALDQTPGLASTSKPHSGYGTVL